MDYLLINPSAARANDADFWSALLLEHDIDVTGHIVENQNELPLLEKVAACALARDDLPSAEDQEMTQFKSLTDKLVDYIAGTEAMIPRVLDAEAAWLNRLKELETLDWDPTELDLIEQLQRDAESAVQQFGELGGQ